MEITLIDRPLAEDFETVCFHKIFTLSHMKNTTKRKADGKYHDQHKIWVCTVFAPTDLVCLTEQSAWTDIQALDFFHRECLPLVESYGLLQCLLVLELSESNRWHLQGCFTWPSAVRLSTLKKRFLPNLKPHLESQIMRDHASYCLKTISSSTRNRILCQWDNRQTTKLAPAKKMMEKVRGELSDLPRERKQVTDLDESVAVAVRDSGMQEASEIAGPGYTMQFLNKMKNYRTFSAPRRRMRDESKSVCALLFFGGTGQGKTRTAIRLGCRLMDAAGFPDVDPYRTMPQEKLIWWEEYDQQKVCVLASVIMRPAHMELSGMNN